MDTSQATQTEMNQVTTDWQIPPSRANIDDPLLQALVVLTKLHHRPFSADALSAGLPLGNDNVMTPELFIRAASKAGLSAKFLQRKLSEFHKGDFPAVLLLKQRRVCILVGIHGDEASIIHPDTGIGMSKLPLSELAEQYMHHCLLAKPSYEFTERAEGLAPDEDKGWFWNDIKQAWPIFSEVLIASFVVNMFALATPLFVMNVYDRVVPNNAVATLWALAIGVLLVFLFEFFMRNTRTYFIENAGKKLDVKLSAKIFQKMLGLRMDSRPQSVGVLSNLMNGFNAFREFITSATVSMVVDVPFALLFIAIIYFIGGSIAMVPLIAMPLIVLGSFILQIPINRLVQSSHLHTTEKQALLIESLAHAETVKTSNAESVLQRRWENLLNDESSVNVKLRLLTGMTLSFAQFITQMTTIALIIYGVYLISESLLSMGGLVACMILTNRAMAPMSQVAGLIGRYYLSKASLDALDNMMQLPVDRQGKGNCISRDRFQGEIECRAMSFAYPGEKSPALSKINFKIKAKDKVGLVGRIGSGKTTLEKLLVGLYKPSEGSILIDGIEINQLDVADLRAQIGYIPQDLELFYGSVRDNIALGVPYVEDSQIIAAARIAGVDQFVDQHPDGYQRQVGERGALLSGGQRQAIAVARALLLDPPIIVMDEPTNLMDDKTEKGLRTRLQEYLEDKTLIIVTHRASMLALVDRLIVIDKGQLVADGSKQYVLDALSDGRVSAG